MVEAADGFVQCQPPLVCFLLLRVLPAMPFPQLNARPSCQLFQGLGKGQIVKFHEETVNITPLPAAKAVERVAVRVDDKGGVLVGMERTKPLVMTCLPS